MLKHYRLLSIHFLVPISFLNFWIKPIHWQKSLIKGECLLWGLEVLPFDDSSSSEEEILEDEEDDYDAEDEEAEEERRALETTPAAQAFAARGEANFAQPTPEFAGGFSHSFEAKKNAQLRNKILKIRSDNSHHCTDSCFPKHSLLLFII